MKVWLISWCRDRPSWNPRDERQRYAEANPVRRAKELAFSTYEREIVGWDKDTSEQRRSGAVTGAAGSAGFVLTVIFVFVTIISPDQFGKEWSNYHALTYLGGAIFLFSLPGVFIDARLRSSTQVLLLLGFIVAMGVSEAANGWLGGAIVSWETFLPSVVVFFFIVANVTTVRRLKILMLTIVTSGLVVVVEALCGYYAGFQGRTFIIYQALASDRGVWGQFERIRGAGFLGDPNDFAQFLLIALPITFISWRAGHFVPNLRSVIVPAGLLLWAIFLTHSRGGLIALALLALVSIRKRLGTTLSVVVIALASLAMIALNFTGGRLISAGAGADRLWLWSSGLEMFKSAPLFGVGFGKFSDHAELTAHNSFILCLAELGFVGCSFWVALLVTTIMGLTRIIRVREALETDGTSAAKIVREEHSDFLNPAHFSSDDRAAIPIESSTSMNVQTWAGEVFESAVPTLWIKAIRLGVISFIATSWFLSRAYQSTLYLILGLATSTIMLDRYGDEPAARIRWVSYTFAIEAALIVFIYLIVRLRF
jgi:putative inorganic carbon (hco3(-)) transporter